MITYTTGDATHPIGPGRKLICHICNDIGKWGKGFVLSISDRWPHVRDQYIEHYRSDQIRLGDVQYVDADKDITVANMFAQNGIKTSFNPKPISYKAVAAALEKVALYAIKNRMTIHMPRIGTGLAGGNWKTIEHLINTHLCSKKISVTVYDLPQSKS